MDSSNETAQDNSQENQDNAQENHPQPQDSLAKENKSPQDRPQGGHSKPNDDGDKPQRAVDPKGGGEEARVFPEFVVPDPRHRQEAPDRTDDKKGKKEKKRGQNKNRPPPMKFSRSDRICPIFVDKTESEPWPECQFPNCAFQHDTKAFWEKKPDDIGTDCVMFQTYGRCPRGLTCRFGQNHVKVTEDRVYNLENKELLGQWVKPRELNHLEKDLQIKLRKNLVDFKTCDKIVDTNFKQREIRKDNNLNQDEPEAKKTKVEVENGVTSVCLPEKKKIDWNNKLYLAPLTTVGNLPFRRICKKFGVDITCGEMAMGLQLLQGHQPEWALVQRHQSEDVFGIQVCGCSPQQMTRLAQLVEDHIDCDFVDINLGCPIDLVYKRGMGSGLMGRKKPLEVMIRSMTQVLTRPLTVKMRTGIYSDKRLAHSLIPSVREWGADMVTLHGRSREQRYYRLADWQYIGECGETAKPMPLYGNGDIMTFEDYQLQKEASKVDGIMIARGALIKPWIFEEIKEQKHWDISSTERLEMIQDYANYGLDHWGSDDRGVETTRRFLLEWLSFLHRYVPHGILSHPPQKINQRIPFYKGRNEMETLLSSPDCKDWIKITEMFLGKVPAEFSFEPKHRAHSYK